MRDTHHDIRFARVVPCFDADRCTGVVSIETGMAGWRRTNRQCLPKGVYASLQRRFIDIDSSPALKQGSWCLAYLFTSAQMVPPTAWGCDRAQRHLMSQVHASPGCSSCAENAQRRVTHRPEFDCEDLHVHPSTGYLAKGVDQSSLDEQLRNLLRNFRTFAQQRAH
jgi:hypothetical protein